MLGLIVQVSSFIRVVFIVCDGCFVKYNRQSLLYVSDPRGVEFKAQLTSRETAQNALLIKGRRIKSLIHAIQCCSPRYLHCLILGNGPTGFINNKKIENNIISNLLNSNQLTALRQWRLLKLQSHTTNMSRTE